MIISRWEKTNRPVDHECKPMQMVQVAQGAVNCNVAWPIVCQGHQDKKIILPNVKREVEDATPTGQGKNIYEGCWSFLHLGYGTCAKH
jgi:hypothetical protein